MPWRLATREDLDDEHTGAAARAWARVDALGILGGAFRLWLDGGSWHCEQLSGLGDGAGALAIGEQSVVTDAVEALG